LPLTTAEALPTRALGALESDLVSRFVASVLGLA
jgi:hypothetical protein